jgi:alpha-tubulin suppressor-like RCC1 family protein
MKCWGYNGWGQIGTLAAGVQTTPSNLPGYTSNVSAIAAGHHHTCALTTAGAVSCFGYSWNNNLSPGINSGAVDISAGYLHTCALMSYGGVKCWGRNDSGGQLGDGTNTNRVAAVDVLGLTSGVTAITTGMEFSCALLNTGAVKCWGYNGYGQIGDGTNTNRNVPTQVSGIESGAVAIVGGNNHACALLATGAVKCWGANYYGQIGDTTTSNRLTPITITSLGTSIRSISAGWEHTCAVTTSGAAKCWGRNSEGSLGDGTFTHRYAPVDVVGLDSGVLAINADKSLTTCATVSGNNVKCWGYNAWGNVGDASTDSRSSPVNVVGLPSGTAESTTLGALTLPSSSYTTSSADFTLTAPTSSRAGTFSYASSNSEVATVNAETGVVHIEGIGTAVLGASIGGNGQYRATSAQVTITVGFSCANGGLCSIGDTGPGGGVVFYDAGSNQSWGRYLEFAPSTSQVSRTWSTGANQQITVTGADGTAIGTGLENTALIAAQSGNLAASSAASYAASYSNNNKSDWFVPSKAELNELCKYARNTGQAAGSSTRCSGGSAPTLRGFTADWHWSSSQSGNNGALDQNFYDGDQGGDGKDWTGIVRPVRAITPLTDCQLAIACAVGDLGPAGGRIIYVNPTSSNAYDFVEAAPTDIAPTLWCAGPKANTVIGSDNAYRDFDSAPIVSTVQLRNCTSGAGTSAQNYSANGISGWQIPNHALVSRMRTALFDNGLGSFISTDYLTSNEQDATHYVTVDMTNGQMSYPDKSTATRLRPVRFFAKADRSRKIPTLNLSVPATSYAYGAADFYTSASSTGLNDFGGSFTSRGPISYASSNTAVATVDSYTGLVSIVGSGSFTITATQGAWGIFKAPTSVSTNISVANGTPQFSGFAIPGSGYRADDGSFNTTNATSSSSSGAITYTSSNTAVATINATTGRVTLVAAGTTTLTATLAQNGFWDGATLTVPLAVGALCADGGECRMGDIGPGGGRIFLLPTSTGNTTNKYFEAAVSDLPSALAWCDDTATSITGANGYAYGTGETNTTAIDAACTSGAAQGAADYINNSIGDWYLPSLDELTAMLAERTTIGGFASASYWSSSEENGGYAKRLGFPDGGMSGHVKSQLFQVRPIRSFEIRRSCLDIKNATGTNTNGIYTIALNVSGAIINTPVYCLMDSAMSGGGWTLTMKAPRNSTSFGFNANYWTTANTLNVGNTSNVTSDATSAKFNTFNYLSGTEMLAIFPDAGINGGSVTGQTYGWTWKQTIPSGPKTPLEIFSGPMNQFIGDADNFSGFDTRIFSRQKDIRFYGFNWNDNLKSRWGFGWNENGGGLWPNGVCCSNDVTGGIGLNWGEYSAGDGHFGWSTSVGLSRPMSFETYVR